MKKESQALSMLLYAFLGSQYHTLGNSFQVSVIDGNISDLRVAWISFRYTNFALFFLKIYL